MKSRRWSCAAVLVAIAAFSAGCGEDISPGELSKLSDAGAKTKKEEPKEEVDPAFTAAASPDGASEQPMGDPSGAVPPPAPSGQGGYGQTATSSGAAAGPANTYGQPAPIRLASEVPGLDLAKADGGVGRKGQGYGGGIITEPVRQFFIAGDRIKLNIELPNNLKMYRAENNNQNPPNVEAFVKGVLDVSSIQLPELRPGEFYVYDPTGKDLDGVLFVARPPAQ